MKKQSIIKILVVMLLMIAVSLTTSACTIKDKEIIISDYLVVEESGYDGYGTISVSLDYETMVNNRAKELEASEETRLKWLSVFEHYEPFTIKFESSDVLKNGDVIKFTFDTETKSKNALAKEMNAKFITEPFEYTLTNLVAVEDFDPFGQLNINSTDAISGKGSLEFSIDLIVNDEKVVWSVAHDGENGKISNGDILTLTLNEDIDYDAFTRATGRSISNTTMQYEVADFGEYVVDENVFRRINIDNINTFNKIIEDWVISGLNDENAMAEHRTYQLCGYLLYTNNDQNTTVDTVSESMIVAIYKITEAIVPEGYYVFIGLEDILSVHGGTGLCVDNGKTLPDSFIHYKKETVRYSEKFGWGQDYEGMGFLYDGFAYAGHRDINETISYLDTTYGASYKHKHISDSLEKILTAQG